MVTDARCLAASENDREVTLEPDPASVRKARDFVAKQLPELGFACSVEDGVLIASELVTNALQWAPETPCLLLVRRGAGNHPVIEVHDSSLEQPELQDPDLAAEGGRGLRIVNALCVTWGSVKCCHGKAVIATLRR